MKKKELLKLAELLETRPKWRPEFNFDLSFFCNGGRDCGTAGCALGLAGLSGQFKGLSLSIAGYPVYRDETCWSAIDSAFGLTAKQSRFLFSSSQYQNRSGRRAELAVAKRIRAFVAGKEQP